MKLKMSLDDLRVASFETEPGRARQAGTVRAHSLDETQESYLFPCATSCIDPRTCLYYTECCRDA
jgi:hypothetical protein